MLTPWSHVPHVLLSYTDNMNFLQRFYNVILSSYEWIYRSWVILPTHNRDAKEIFGYLESKYKNIIIMTNLNKVHFLLSTEERGVPLPSVEELERNISLILVNTHRSISPPRPAMPGIINVGGAHIRPPKPLPDDILVSITNFYLRKKKRTFH